MNDQNLEELLQSPYGDGEWDDVGDTSWKLPVGAAIAGALAMAAYVIFAIVTGPTEDTDSSTSPAPAAPVEAVGFPPLYVTIGDGVAMRAEVLQTGADGTAVFVSSVVAAGIDPATIVPAEVVAWDVQSSGNDPTMVRQFAAKGSLGGVTVILSPLFDPANATLIGTLPGATEGTEDRLELPPDVPAVVTDHRIVGRDTVVVIDELIIGGGYGSMRWHLEGGIGAKVDVVVEFDGVALPLTLVAAHDAQLGFGTGVRPLAPLWGPDGTTRLVSEGESLSESNVADGITVTFRVSVVTEAGGTIEVPIVAVVSE